MAASYSYCLQRMTSILNEFSFVCFQACRHYYHRIFECSAVLGDVRCNKRSPVSTATRIPENVTENFRVGFFRARIVVGFHRRWNIRWKSRCARTCEHIFGLGYFVIYSICFSLMPLASPGFQFDDLRLSLPVFTETCFSNYKEA